MLSLPRLVAFEQFAWVRTEDVAQHVERCEVNGRKRITSCKCERCVELCHVLKLATDFVSLKRVAQYQGKP